MIILWSEFEKKTQPLSRIYGYRPSIDHPSSTIKKRAHKIFSLASLQSSTPKTHFKWLLLGEMGFSADNQLPSGLVSSVWRTRVGGCLSISQLFTANISSFTFSPFLYALPPQFIWKTEETKNYSLQARRKNCPSKKSPIQLESKSINY